ncbi:MAG: hypothetical protein GY720_01125 [bacterium]|nr:hypothetical protein [bacterium]
MPVVSACGWAALAQVLAGVVYPAVVALLVVLVLFFDPKGPLFETIIESAPVYACFIAGMPATSSPPNRPGRLTPTLRVSSSMSKDSWVGRFIYRT